MKETDFPTMNCRSEKKITQIKTTIEKQRKRNMVEMYIYSTKKYFVKLYKRYYMFNLPLTHFFLFVFINFLLKSAIISYCFVSPDFMSRPFCSNGASSGAYFVNRLTLPLVDFKMNVIKWKLHFVSWNFGLKSALWLQIAPSLCSRAIL